MNAADLNPWLIVAGVSVICVVGVALGFTLPQRAKDTIGSAFAIPLLLLPYLLLAASSYELLVVQERLGKWSLEAWLALLGLLIIALIRSLVRTVSDRSTARGNRA